MSVGSRLPAPPLKRVPITLRAGSPPPPPGRCDPPPCSEEVQRVCCAARRAALLAPTHAPSTLCKSVIIMNTKLCKAIRKRAAFGAAAESGERTKQYALASTASRQHPAPRTLAAAEFASTSNAKMGRVCVSAQAAVTGKSKPHGGAAFSRACRPGGGVAPRPQGRFILQSRYSLLRRGGARYEFVFRRRVRPNDALYMHKTSDSTGVCFPQAWRRRGLRCGLHRPEPAAGTGAAAGGVMGAAMARAPAPSRSPLSATHASSWQLPHPVPACPQPKRSRRC